MNLKTRQELIDYDYLDKLGPTEMGYLDKFTSEYVNADMDRKNFKNNFHNTLELKQDCDRRNNKRKEDLYTNLKVINMIDDWDEHKSRISGQEDLDDVGEEVDEIQPEYTEIELSAMRKEVFKRIAALEVNDKNRAKIETVLKKLKAEDNFVLIAAKFLDVLEDFHDADNDSDETANGGSDESGDF